MRRCGRDGCEKSIGAGKRRDARYCSTKCQQKAWGTRERTTAACLWCGADITHKRSHARFCNTSCSMKHWHRAHPGYARASMLKSVYGLDVATYDAIWARQRGACAICRTPFDASTKATVDHCHATGRVRGLLCALCNQGLGAFRDTLERLANAIEYLAA